MNLLYEYMIRVESNGYICRIWHADKDIAVELRAFVEGVLDHNAALSVMVTDIVCLEGINSVEIIYKSTGDGMCVHKDWP